MYESIRSRIRAAESKQPANYCAVSAFCSFIHECAEGNLAPDDKGIIRIEVPDEIAMPLIRCGFRGFEESI